MNTDKNLIILKGEDKTSSIKWVKYKGHLAEVFFYSDPTKAYTYASHDIAWYKNKGNINIDNKVIYHEGMQLQFVESIVDFEDYVKVNFGKYGYKTCTKKSLVISDDVLSTPRTLDRFNYFRSIATLTGQVTDDGENTLSSQYDLISSLGSKSLLGQYLTGSTRSVKHDLEKHPIFPFGINVSQKKAVENALNNKVSFIEGPPGTGKTQTILNIVANLIVQGKTVAVVSNNNSATLNVVDKLAKYNFDFLCAYLGNAKNKDEFIKSQNGKYPKLNIRTNHTLRKIRHGLDECVERTNSLLEKKNELATSRSKLDILKFEFDRFNEQVSVLQPRLEYKDLRLNEDELLQLWVEVEDLLNNEKRLSLFNKIRLLFRYNKYVLRQIEARDPQFISFIKMQYYDKAIKSLGYKIKSLERDVRDLDKSIASLEILSLEYFKLYLSGKYKMEKERTIFTLRDLKTNTRKFVGEYPLILSTTYSLGNCLSKSYHYDYVIVDEASQVDLATGLLALQYAENIVVVGDTKQLPNVIDSEHKTAIEYLYKKEYPSYFNFTANSFLTSMKQCFSQGPHVLLREHYRCNPKIIEFCNRKFYDNQLIVMTEDKGGKSPLTLCYTPVGNHGRGHENQREVDVVAELINKELAEVDKNDIGVITPYNKQVDCFRNSLPQAIEVSTVHKYQGREKPVVILSTVLNEINDFVDDPQLINVAVSRAVDRLILVTANNEKNENTNYGDLAKYIQYRTGDVVHSKVSSVFDLLYKQYYKARLKYLKNAKKISQYDSENLMYKLIMNVLSSNPSFSGLDCVCHVALSDIAGHDLELNDRQTSYLYNPCTHVDFLIYNKINNGVVLVIEVDGFRFHKQGTAQHERDLLKNEILEAVEVPFIRFSTNGSREKEILTKRLAELVE